MVTTISDTVMAKEINIGVAGIGATSKLDISKATISVHFIVNLPINYR